MESLAQAHLENAQLKLVEANYHCKFGELDLIMEEAKTLVFVEVRYRQRSHYVSALESITVSKQKKLIRTAHNFLQSAPHYRNHNCRFDVIAIEGREDSPHINWVKNAFLAY